MGYQQVFREGRVQDYELEIRRRDGHLTPVLYNASLYRDEEGQVAGVFAAACDISKRKRAEEELRIDGQRLALAMKAGRSGAFEWDIQINIHVWSPEIEELYGVAPGEFGSGYESWESLLLPEDLEKARAAIQESLRTGEFQSEWRIRRRNDGQIRWLAARAVVLCDDAGRPTEMLGINLDLTDRRFLVRGREAAPKENEREDSCIADRGQTRRRAPGL
jgi:PAS domain S-box-containing protein